MTVSSPRNQTAGREAQVKGANPAVAVAVLNGEPRVSLRVAIESVLFQSSPAQEIVILDPLGVETVEHLAPSFTSAGVRYSGRVAGSGTL